MAISKSNKRKILISGHRGYHDKEIDNTKKAFQRAIDEGIDYIEFDVKRTSDGIPVIYHDSTLNKLTNGTGAIEKKTLAELRKLRYNDGQEFQTLEEMLEQCAGKINLMLELKSDNIEQETMDLIKKFAIEDSVLVQSFKRYHIENCHRIYPDERIKWGFCIGSVGIFGKVGHFLGLDRFLVERTYNSILEPYPYVSYLNVDGPIISGKFVKHAVQKRIKIILGAMNTVNYLNKLDEWGVEIINCNNPKFIVESIKIKYPEKFKFSNSISYA